MSAFTLALPVTLEGAEKALLAATLDLAQGNKKEAARLLGVSRSALYAKLKRFGLFAGRQHTQLPAEASPPPPPSPSSPQGAGDTPAPPGAAPSGPR